MTAWSDEAVEAAARAEWAHDHFIRDWEDAHASDRAHIRRRVRAALSAADAVRSRREMVARPGEEYHENMGDVLWWRFPIDEPPYAGMPGDDDWPGYHTHFTPIPVPMIAAGDTSNARK